MIVYIVHFDRPLKHARHYIGKTESYGRRMAHHKAGRGAAILRAANAAGIKWRVVARWFGGRALEKKLKARKDTASLCPVCIRKRRAYKAAHNRRSRAAKKGKSDG